MKINEKNLSSFATTPPYDLEGFLNKRGEVNKAWQKRYFVLKGNLLFYFEKKSDREPLGLIVVEGCTIELAQNEDQFSFQMVFNGNRTYILSAESQETMELWMKALTCAGYEYKKLMLAELKRQLNELEELSKRKNSIDEQLAASTGSASNTPKPPPRRTNPFNRPAPMPPAKPARTPTNVSDGKQQIGNITNNNNNSILNTSSPISTDSTLSPTETRLAKSSFYIRSVPNLSTKHRAEDQQETMAPVQVDFQVFKILHERFKQQVLSSTKKYFDIKESANKPLIDL